MSSRRTLLIGEQPPLGASLDTYSPLFPLPAGSSGHRLRILSGLSKLDYLRSFDRMNLIGWPSEVWPAEDAAWTALTMMRGCVLRERNVILLGERVRSAFSVAIPALNAMEIAKFRHFVGGGGVTVALLPRPSGLDRAWNDPGVRERAKALLLQAARDFPAYQKEEITEGGGRRIDGQWTGAQEDD